MFSHILQKDTAQFCTFHLKGIIYDNGSFYYAQMQRVVRDALSVKAMLV